MGTLTKSTKTVLVVEDNANQRTLYAQELEDEGYRVLVAEDGRQALEILGGQQTAPDVVVLDICMPGMDGMETLEAILARDHTMPVVLNTAYTSYKNNFMTWSATAYVVKSADLGELKATIRRALEGRGNQ